MKQKKFLKSVSQVYLFDWLAHRLGLWLLFRLAVSAGEFSRSRLQSLNKIEQQAEINISSHIIKPSMNVSVTVPAA